jgi:hypothetical protein
LFRSNCSHLAHTRQFLCEGTHEAILSFPSHVGHEIERHRVRFLVSRPSLFYSTRFLIGDDDESSCISGRCPFNVGLELSQTVPDEEYSRKYAAER